ncbi:MAG: hypothetical protein JNN05_03720, partial [Candidatus Omnitrophica bacterium]|nr:hypothetical protein [Candidatus Omnitrophota bacterium]
MNKAAPIMLITRMFVLAFAMGTFVGYSHSLSATDASAESLPIDSKASESIIKNIDSDQRDLLDVIDTIAQSMDRKVDVSPAVTGKVAVHMKNVPALDALKIVLAMSSLAYYAADDSISVTTPEEFEKLRGQKFAPDIQTQIQPVSYIDSEEMVTYLQSVKSPQGKIYALHNPDAVALLDTPANIQELLKSYKEIDIPRFKMVFALTFAKAAQLSEKIKPMLTKNIGRIRTDEASNKIIVTDTSAKIEEIHKIVDELDHRDRKVHIDTKIIQIELNDEHHMGIDWEAIVSEYQSLDMKIQQPDASQSTKKRKLGIGIIANDDYSILIEALDTVGKVDILSERDIATTNNKEARVLVGPRASDDPDSQLSRKPQEVDLPRFGLKLFITPTIHPDGDTTLKIRAQISSVVAAKNDQFKPREELSEAQVTLR